MDDLIDVVMIFLVGIGILTGLPLVYVVIKRIFGGKKPKNDSGKGRIPPGWMG